MKTPDATILNSAVLNSAVALSQAPCERWLKLETIDLNASGDDDVEPRMMELGLVPGTRLKRFATGTKAGATVIDLRGYRLSLPARFAAIMMVLVLP